MKTHRALSILLFPMAAASLFAQGTLTLIGPSTRNGGFEDGILSPWTSPAGSAAVVQDSTFAAEGAWFAVVSDTLPANVSIARPSIFQRPAADPSGGTTFSLNFAARNGIAAFEGVRVFFSAQNSDATTVFTTNAFFTLPPLGWQGYQAEFQVSSGWQGGQLTLGLQFEKLNAIGGTTYTGYLDNIVLQQIPEPASGMLFCLGVFSFVALLVRRRKPTP